MGTRLAIRHSLGAALTLLTAACTVSSTDIPGLTGPSELALSFRLAASPDTVPQDGVSQSAITVTAYNASGQPAAGQQFRLDVFAGGAAVDYGTLSSKSLVTGSNGKASIVYTAPPAVPAGGSLGSCRGLPGPCVTVSATPVGAGFNLGTNTQTVDLHLVPLGVIAPPADTPAADFAITPQPVTANVPVFFDASASCGSPLSGTACTSPYTIVSYAWAFGDGTSATGRATSHSFAGAGTHTVTLTVTNDGGKSASAMKTVPVTAGTAPSASFVFSPGAPVIGQQVQFNAATSQAAPSRTIVRWDWNWGDGETGTGMLEEHDFQSAGTFNVTLTVTDDTGLTGTTSRAVSVGGANPTPQL